MAIIKDDSLSKDDEAVFRVNNGDLQALKNIKETWGLKNLESALIFATGVLRIARNTPSKNILVKKLEYNEPVALTPSDQLLEKPVGDNNQSNDQSSPTAAIS